MFNIYCSAILPKFYSMLKLVLLVDSFEQPSQYNKPVAFFSRILYLISLNPNKILINWTGISSCHRKCLEMVVNFFLFLLLGECFKLHTAQRANSSIFSRKRNKEMKNKFLHCRMELSSRYNYDTPDTYKEHTAANSFMSSESYIYIMFCVTLE